MPRVAFCGIQKLASDEARQEEGVDSQSDNLEWKETQVRAQRGLPTARAGAGRRRAKRAHGPRTWV